MRSTDRSRRDNMSFVMHGTLRCDQCGQAEPTKATIKEASGEAQVGAPKRPEGWLHVVGFDFCSYDCMEKKRLSVEKAFGRPFAWPNAWPNRVPAR
jgi:hypothetical protein